LQTRAEDETVDGPPVLPPGEDAPDPHGRGDVLGRYVVLERIDALVAER
jgi:hypothetical protein